MPDEDWEQFLKDFEEADAQLLNIAWQVRHTCKYTHAWFS